VFHLGVAVTIGSSATVSNAQRERIIVLNCKEGWREEERKDKKMSGPPLLLFNQVEKVEFRGGLIPVSYDKRSYKCGFFSRKQELAVKRE
jgi:hypothetical protein